MLCRIMAFVMLLASATAFQAAPLQRTTVVPAAASSVSVRTPPARNLAYLCACCCTPRASWMPLAAPELRSGLS